MSKQVRRTDGGTTFRTRARLNVVVSLATMLMTMLMAIVSASGAAMAAADEDAASDKAATDRRADLDTAGVYAISMARTDTGLHIVEYWSRGATLRAHATIAGHPLITLVNGDTYYTLDPVFRRGVAIPRGPRAIQADQGKKRLFANEYEHMLEAGAEKVRTEETPVGPVHVYRVTDRDGRRSVWVTGDEYRLPLRFETYNRPTGQTGRLDYMNWSPLRLSDEFFLPPGEGWDIVRVPTYESWLRAKPSEEFKQAPIIFPLLLHGRP